MIDNFCRIFIVFDVHRMWNGISFWFRSLFQRNISKNDEQTADDGEHLEVTNELPDKNQCKICKRNFSAENNLRN